MSAGAIRLRDRQRAALLEMPAAAMRCATEGCPNVAIDWPDSGGFCGRCAEEIEALDTMQLEDVIRDRARQLAREQRIAAAIAVGARWAEWLVRLWFGKAK
jgi:hypothetical protein